MATGDNVRDALRKAAEELLNRTLTRQEIDELIRRFNQAEGSYRDRAQGSIAEIYRIDRAQLVEKTAASDNTDRLINDLKRTLDDWKPGT